MAERSFAPATGQAYKPQNLYMRIIVTKLNRKKIVTKEDAKFVFTMYKGEEQFDKTSEIPIAKETTGLIALTDISVDFVLINYNPHSKYKFSLRMANVKERVIKEIGEYVLETNRYIDEYLMSEHGVFQETINLCDEFQADIEFFVDNSQYGLQRLIRDIKNPKPKKQGDFEDSKISHTKTREFRTKMDNEQKIEENVHREQKFKRFSPKKDVVEQKNKKVEELNLQRIQDERKAKEEEEERLKVQKIQEEKKKKNRQFVPRREWIIPQAQALLNKSKARQLKRKSSKDSQHEKAAAAKPKSQENKQMRKSREKPKFQEESFLEKLPVNPKILIAAIVILILITGYFLLKGESSQASSNVPIFPSVKEERKEKGKAKTKKAKK